MTIEKKIETLEFIKGSASLYAGGMYKEWIKSLDDAIKSLKVQEQIQDLIDEYQSQIEVLEEESMNIIHSPYLTGKIGVYGKAVKDLQALLEVSE